MASSLENQSLYYPSTSKYTTGTVHDASETGLLVYGYVDDHGRCLRAVGHDPQFVDGQIVSAKWAVVEELEVKRKE